MSKGGGVHAGHTWIASCGPAYSRHYNYQPWGLRSGKDFIAEGEAAAWRATRIVAWFLIPLAIAIGVWWTWG